MRVICVDDEQPILDNFKNRVSDFTQIQSLQMFTDAKTGHVYRSTAINELGDGVYIADKNNNLIKLNSMEEVNKVIDHITKDTDKQTARYNVIREAAKSWFDHQKELTKKEPSKEMEKQKTEIEMNEPEMGGSTL